MEAARAVAARAIKKANETERETPSRLIYDAVSKGELERVRELIVRFANANYQERHRISLRTPIHQAAELGFLDICKVLCEEAQASISTIDKDGNTPFHLAAARGHFDIVKYFQQRYDPDPTLRNARSYTAFHLAAFGGHLEVLKFLDEDAGVDPHAEDQFWNTAAHQAASRGHLPVLKYLCSMAKLNPESLNRWKRTPLHQAAAHGHTDIARYLIKQCHVDPTCSGLDGCTPLHLAVSNGHLDLTQFLVESIGVPTNPKNVNGDTPIHCAAFSGQANICRYLVEKGHCQVNYKNKNGDTPIIIAAIWNQQEVLRYLVEEAKADPCLRNEMGFTAMHMAAREWNQEVCEYICKVAPECARIRDNKGLTPLMVVLNKWGQTKVNRMFLHKEGYSPFHVACEKGFEDMVRYLLICAKDYGDLIHTPGANGDTPLIAVIERDHIRLIELLLQKGADVNFRSANGNTPLLTAIREQNMNLVKVLIASDAKINYPTDGDHTPLTLACSIGNMDFVNLLLKQGAQLELPNRNGETPLVMACKMRNMDLILALLEYGSQINYPVHTKFTPLIAACMFGEVEMVSLLLSKGAVIDMPNVKRGTPLAAASKRGQADIVRLLLNRMMNQNLSVDVSGITGHTPVMKAALHGHTDVVRMLVDQGASIYLPDGKGNTPAIEAARREHDQVLEFLVGQGADIDMPGENGRTANEYAERVPRLRRAMENGLARFRATISGPIQSLQHRGYLNQSDPVQDGFYFSSEVVPVRGTADNLKWGKLLDPRCFPIGSLDGIIIAFDSRRDSLLRAMIGRAQDLIRTFPNARARASALAMLTANECGGTAIMAKRELARTQQERQRSRSGRDILNVGDLLPGFGISRLRSVAFKFLLGKMATEGGYTVDCRVVSRPSSGSGYDRVGDPWPSSFTWAEIAFDGDGPYFVVDLMHVPGRLMFENGRDAARYRSGLVDHDQDPIPPLAHIQQVAVRDEIVRVDKEAAIAAKPARKKATKVGRRRRKSSVVFAGKLKSRPSTDSAASVLENISETSVEHNDELHGHITAVQGLEKVNGSDSDNDEFEPVLKRHSVGEDIPPGIVQPETMAARLQVEEEENALAIGGRVDRWGIYQHGNVVMTAYPVPVYFNASQKETAMTWFKDDIQVYETLRHRCIDRPMAIDYSTRSIVRRRNDDLIRLDEYVRDRQANLGADAKLSIVLQIAETMEYLHTLAAPIVHGRLRIKEIFISGLTEDDDDPAAAAASQPIVHFLDVGLPRRVDPILKQNPLDGAAVYYPPERLALSEPEGATGADTLPADVYAFGVVAVFVASGVVPWADFQVRDIQEFYREKRSPTLPEDDAAGQVRSWAPVIQQIFAHDPDDRPSFTQVIRLFQQHVGSAIAPAPTIKSST